MRRLQTPDGRLCFAMGIALYVAATPPAGVLAAPSPSLLDRFIGVWRGDGTLFGEPGAFSMTWERAVDGAFVRLIFQNPAIHAEALYRSENGRTYAGTWADSRGVILPLAAVARDSVLETSWGDADTERGETHYRLLGPDTMEVTDYVLKDDAKTRFAVARYARTRAP